ncbi:hypothetical protein K8R66_03295 [bacterium]|nr:hypothetical protein [bacterium]
MLKNNKTLMYLKISSIFYFLFFLWVIFKNLNILNDFEYFIICVLIEFLAVLVLTLLFSLILSFLFYLTIRVYKLFKKHEVKYKKFTDYLSSVFMISSAILILLASIILNLGLHDNSMKSNNYDSHTINDLNNSSKNREWHTFNSAENKFKIDFPSSPTHDTTPNSTESPKVDIYYSEQPNEHYSVVVLTFLSKTEVSNPELLMKNLINNIAGTEGKAILSNFTYYRGNKALNFEIRGKNTDSSTYIQGRLILANQTLYNLFVRYEDINYDNDYKKFIDSLTLTE